MLTQRPKGTNDFLPQETWKWQYVEQILREVCRQYGYGELRTPIFEHTELFQRGVGETTDIVEKEMYTFLDKGGRSVTLRPEGTAAAARAYLENRLQAGPQPVKVYYIGPMFRYDKPQAGRYRQFHQFGIEVFGSDEPVVDAEVIAMAMEIYRRLGIKDLELNINSVGCPVCRARHREALQEFLRPQLASLCKDCQNRFERNPLRILDCKQEGCQAATRGAPTITRQLCPDCKEHFDQVQTLLKALCVPFTVNERLVRGLDYYTKTAFEIMVREIGAQSSICGGGRYNGLVGELGGEDVPGIGFALGLERTILTMEKQGVAWPEAAGTQVFVAVLGTEAREQALVLTQQLRSRGLAAETDLLGRSLKAQLKQADRLKVSYTVIVGGDELQRGEVQLRSMSDSSQQAIKLEQAVDYLTEKLKP